MGTEDRASQCIDEMTPRKALSFLLKEMEAPRAVRRAKKQLFSAISGIEAHLRANPAGRVIHAGSGTPGREGPIEGAEWYPTFFFPKGRVRFMLAGGRKALTQSVEGAEGNREDAIAQVRRLNIGPGDVVIATASSGTTPFTLEAMRETKRRGALTVGIANNKDTPVLTECDLPIFLDTGAEPVAGSTRMKAGMAQSLVFRMISTLVMVRLGYVYKGMMINVRARSNAKLMNRATKIVQMITGCGEQVARTTLESVADWEVGVAVLILLRDFSPKVARMIFIKKCKRNLREALEA